MYYWHEVWCLYIILDTFIRTKNIAHNMDIPKQDTYMLLQKYRWFIWRQRIELAVEHNRSPICQISINKSLLFHRQKCHCYFETFCNYFCYFSNVWIYFIFRRTMHVNCKFNKNSRIYSNFVGMNLFLCYRNHCDLYLASLVSTTFALGTFFSANFWDLSLIFWSHWLQNFCTRKTIDIFSANSVSFLGFRFVFLSF